MIRLFTCLFAIATFPVWAQTAPLSTISPASPTSDDEIELRTHARACYHANARLRVPDQIRVRYGSGSLSVDVDPIAMLCFAAGDPLTLYPYTVPLGRLAPGTYAVQVKPVSGGVEMQTLVVAPGVKPLPGALPDAMTVSPATVESGETVTIGLPLRECTTAFGRERVWSPGTAFSAYPIVVSQPLSGCASEGAPGGTFLLPYQWVPTGVGQFHFPFERHTYLGPSTWLPAGPTTAFDAWVEVRGLAPVSVQHGLWWNAPAGSESGWGINLMQQGSTILATWFTFDFDGSPLWLVMAAQRTAADTYTGTLYRGTGPAFGDPFDPARVNAVNVGTATLTFSDADNATFAYTYKKAAPIGSGLPAGTLSATKSITRQIFGSSVPVCIWGPPTELERASNYTDMWWNAPAGSESGWGVAVTHQGDTVFASWFTFAADGKPLWLVVSAQPIAPNKYSGRLFTGTGPAFDAPQFDSTKVVPKEIGTASFVFVDGNAAEFSYVVNGIAQTKHLTRQVFTPPGTVCR